MRDILDPSGRWIGVPLGAAVFGNKRPIALEDTLVVVRDSGPTAVDVLANDTDPEGGPLDLISASAALGTAAVAADDTVLYTPPPGLTGFDTVIYEITDDQGQTRAGQVNVTIIAPALSIDTQPDNTLVVNAASGLVDVTVTQPAAFAGTWEIDTADFAGGPVNLVAPTVAGTLSAGTLVSATAGLWVYDLGAGLPTTGWQWRRNGVDIPGATAADYTITPSDLGTAITVVEIQSDAFGQRSAESAALSTQGGAFQPGEDTALIGWWDASDTASITNQSGAVDAWADKANGPALIQTNALRQPVSGARQLNGLNVIDFDGTHQLEAARTLPANGDVAFHMVLVVDTVTNAYEAVLAVDAANDFQIDAASDTAFDGRINTAGIAGSPLNFTGGPFAGALLISLIFDRTGTGTMEAFVSGVSRGSTAYSTAIDANVALSLMTNRSRNARVNGAIAEFVITGNVSNRTTYHDYLAGKWGVS